MILIANNDGEHKYFMEGNSCIQTRIPFPNIQTENTLRVEPPSVDFRT